ncbi:Ras and EF-hand domain-containing protein homolog [Clonorchis sinensis]|nr:Ras and EF-hand domain-containing protein homolog [Clonorchis sinensis]
MNRNRRPSSAQIRDQNHLQEVLAKLESREEELGKLKKQLFEQEVQILVDRRELLNRDEEKQQLYAQLESLRNIALTRQDEHDFYAQRHGRLTPESTHSQSESLHSYDQHNSSMNTVVDTPTTPKPPERIFKIILIGDTGVGKSSFMHQFCDHVFYPRLSATVGVDFRTRNIRVDKYVYSIQLWDTAGQEKYRSIVRTYFRKVDGVIIVYDVTAPQSFRNVRSWMDQISEFGSEQKVPVIVVGNKIDLRKMGSGNCVTTEMGKTFAETYGVMFLETSVCTSENVDEAVRLLASKMKVEQDAQMATTVQLTEKSSAPIKSCCK